MSKAIPASCSNGVVKIGNVAVGGVQVLSAGVGASTGMIALDENIAFYLTSNATDIAAIIQSVSDMVDKIIAITTALDGESTNPGGQTSAIAALGVLKTTMLLKKDSLK